jgi:C4-dicarboxylate transporter DctM subunit
MSALIIFALLTFLMLSGMPVSISLGLTVLTFLFAFTATPLEAVALKLFTGIEKFEIMAIPFFILAGNFLTHGGVAKRMIYFATSMVGHLRGGLGLSAVFACALFAAVSGSSPATVVAIGSILLPAMVKAGYPKKFGVGVIASSGGLGILIPPSIVMVMYAVSTNSSIGALFMAGVIPGLLLAFMLGFCTWWVAHKNNYPREQPLSWAQRWDAFRKAIWGLLLIVVVMGGIYSGLFTPTEAAAMSAVYAFFIAVFVYKDIGFKDVPKVLLNSANMSAMLLYIITNAVLFSFILTNEQIPQAHRRMADAIRHGHGRLPDCGEHPAAGHGQFHGAFVDHPDHGADPVSDRYQARHRSDPFRRDDHGEYGNRHDHAAGGAQPVCGQRHRQDGSHGLLQGRLALADDHAGLPHADHLRAGRLDLAAKDTGHDVALPCLGDKGPVTPGLCLLWQTSTFAGISCTEAPLGVVLWRRSLRRPDFRQETELKY